MNPLFPFAGRVLLAALGLALAGCAPVQKSGAAASRQAHTGPGAPAVSQPAPDAWVVGTWRLDVGETAAVLARAQFGTQAVVTLKAGAPHPVTNSMHKPFDQKTYDQSKATWEKGLAEMEWQVRFQSDHSGEHASRGAAHPPTVSPLKWQVWERELRIEYVQEKRFKYFTCRIVSSNELLYPMQPLGGYFVLRRSR